MTTTAARARHSRDASRPDWHPMPTEIPPWLPDVSNPKYDERPEGMRLRGAAYPWRALREFILVLKAKLPQGYRFSKASAGVEHARGRRLTWSVEWVTDEHAEYLLEAKQLSRFAIHTEETP